MLEFGDGDSNARTDSGESDGVSEYDGDGAKLARKSDGSSVAGAYGIGGMSTGSAGCEGAGLVIHPTAASPKRAFIFSFATGQQRGAGSPLGVAQPM